MISCGLIPLGMVSQTWPLAVRRPKICDGSLPTTRLSEIDPAPG
jgi:hypothetical protein